MPDHPDTADIDTWHRYFAIENNNRAWDLAGLVSRTREESREMLNAAHTAASHWQAVGTDLNTMRARMLLAEVHALLGFGSSAFELAAEVRDYFLNRTTDDWELAFVHTIHAHAAAAAADSQTHADSYRAAQSALAAIASDEDRDIVLQTFNQVPKPG